MLALFEFTYRSLRREVHDLFLQAMMHLKPAVIVAKVLFIIRIRLKKRNTFQVVIIYAFSSVVKFYNIQVQV